MARLKCNANRRTALEKIEKILLSGEYPQLENKNFCAAYYIQPKDETQKPFYYEKNSEKIEISDLDKNTQEQINKNVCKFLYNNQALDLKIQIGTTGAISDAQSQEYFEDTDNRLGYVYINKDNIEYLKNKENNPVLEPVYEQIYRQVKTASINLDLQNSLALNQNVISLLKECGYLTLGLIRADECSDKISERLQEFGFTRNGVFFMKPFKSFVYGIDEDLGDFLKDNNIFAQYWAIEALRNFAKNYSRQGFSQMSKEILQGLNKFFDKFISKLSLKELLNVKENLTDNFFYPSINNIKNHLLNSTNKDNFEFTAPINFNFNDEEKNNTLQDINYLFLINNLTYRLDVKILNKNNTQEYFLSLKDNVDEALLFLEKSLKHIDAKTYKNNILKFITSIHDSIRSFETNAVNVISSKDFDKILTDYNKLVSSFIKKYCDKDESLDFDIIVSQYGEKTSLTDKVKKSTSKIFDSIIRALTGEKANIILKALNGADDNAKLEVTKDAEVKIVGANIAQIEDNIPSDFRSFFNQDFENEIKNKEAKLVINFIGAPGAGKSYTAKKITELLSQKLDKKVLLVREVATGLILQGKQELLKDQLYVTGEQIAREKDALFHSSIVGTDSPPILGKFYISDLSQSGELEKIIKENEENRQEINIFIKHNKESLKEYSEEGRIHNKERALEIEQKMIDEFKDKDLIFIDRNFSMEDIIEKIIKTPAYKTWEQNNIDGDKMYLKTNNKQNIIAYRYRKLVNNLDFKEMSHEQLAIETATSLALTNGFLGSVNYSTLQHSLNVYKIVANKIKDNPEFKDLDKKEILLKALFHDAVEALIMGDIPTPMKNTMQNYYAEEEKYIKEIYTKLGIKDVQYNSVIDWADKTERNTFMLIHFGNDEEKYINAIDIYLQLLQEKRNLVFSNKEKLQIGINILYEYNNYLEYGDTPMLGNTTLNFIETFKFKNNSGALSEADFKKYGLSMEVNVPIEKTLIEFAAVARSLGLNISNKDILEKYQEINTMPQETYRLDKEFQTKMVKKAIFKLLQNSEYKNGIGNNERAYIDKFDDESINNYKNKTKL